MNLEKLYQEIKEYAENKGVKIIEGSALAKRTFNLEGHSIQEFINLAKDLNCAFIFIDKAEGIDEEYIDLEDNNILKTLEFETEILKLKEKYRSDFNKIAVIKMFFIKESHLFYVDFVADWFEKLNEDMAELSLKLKEIKEENKVFCSMCGAEVEFMSKSEIQEGEEVYCSNCREKKQKDDEVEIRKIAEELSKNESFLKLKNRAMRSMFVEKNYPKVSKRKIYTLTEMARAISEVTHSESVTLSDNNGKLNKY